MIPRSRYSGRVRIATIDIGSNSIHLLIVDVDDEGHFRPIDTEREMVRLGEKGLTVRHLAPEAVERALGALRRFAELARAHDCRTVIATATSAVRESDNGERFLRRVRRETGIRVDMLTGAEEARLIARAVNYGRDLGDERTLGIDIGGGSTEFWITRGGEMLYLTSVRLGAVRLTDGFVRRDPMSERDLDRLKGYVIGTLARTAREVASVGFDRVVVTSGTAITLAEVAAARARGARAKASAALAETEGVELGAAALGRLAKLLAKLPMAERLRIPALPPERADILPAGAVLLHTYFEELGIRRAETCDWALREGVLVDYLEKRFAPSSRATRADELELGDVRRRAVLALSRRYDDDATHARHTTRLSVSLFDQLADLHGLGAAERELLQAAAYLHDIGYAVSHTKHNEHGQYLVTNSELLGFSAKELAVVGNVIRYHGGRRPKRKHTEFARLRPEDRRIARRLSALLTVADALDRSGRGAITEVGVARRNGNVEFGLTAPGGCELELWDARRKAPVFERVFDVKTVFEVAGRRAAATE